MTAATKAPVEHQCIDCAAQPEVQRPRTPRPANQGGPRSKRCATHGRAHDNAQRAKRRAARGQRVYGITPDEQAELWAFQGERCPCGRKPKFRGPETDHDHSCCPAGQSCGQCVRGYLCWHCNREIVGRLEELHGSAEGAAAALRALADHLTDPPLARMRRAREMESA